jgi:formylglycine-generating enzyme required for sulfatase activity
MGGQELQESMKSKKEKESWKWLGPALVLAFAVLILLPIVLNILSHTVFKSPEKNKFLLPWNAPAEKEIPAPSIQGPEPDKNYKIDLGNGVTIDMVALPSGTFTIGSPASEPKRGFDTYESPQAKVKVDEFWIGRYEITQAQYDAVMGEGTWLSAHFSFAYDQGDNHPVFSTSWTGAMSFCAKLSEVTGQRYTLPTEAQWEYACRAGTTTAYFYGNDPGLLGDYAWYKDGHIQHIHEVGQKKPNGWGLYDMYGNVWEWCLSLFRAYPYSETDGRNNLADKQGKRVLRGGSIYEEAIASRSASRTLDEPGYSRGDGGFRIVRNSQTQ